MSHSAGQPGQVILADNLPKVLPDFVNKTNVADSRLGAKALFASDDFFAPKERLLEPQDPVFIVAKFDDNGKWMDGWETRRKRHLGHDYVIIKLARPTKVAGVDIDTSHFTGNYPPSASIDALYAPDLINDDTQYQLDASQWAAMNWEPLIEMTDLQGNSHHFVNVGHAEEQKNERVVTHLRLNIYPDGGVARLRVYGDIQLTSQSLNDEVINLVGALNGGRAIACNDAHFGAVSNLLLPCRAPNMGQGWETRRRRKPGNDWCIIGLGQPGIAESVEIDTAFFKGNFPDQVSIQAVYAPTTPEATLITQSMFWETLLPPQKMQADRVHRFDSDSLAIQHPITHIRVNIFPDGGISRVRVFGKIINTNPLTD